MGALRGWLTALHAECQRRGARRHWADVLQLSYVREAYGGESQNWNRGRQVPRPERPQPPPNGAGRRQAREAAQAPHERVALEVAQLPQPPPAADQQRENHEHHPRRAEIRARQDRDVLPQQRDQAAPVEIPPQELPRVQQTRAWIITGADRREMYGGRELDYLADVLVFGGKRPDGAPWPDGWHTAAVNLFAACRWMRNTCLFELGDLSRERRMVWHKGHAACPLHDQGPCWEAMHECGLTGMVHADAHTLASSRAPRPGARSRRDRLE